MENRYILTPYFLDEEVPELENLFQPDWVLNKPPLTSDVKEERISTLHQSLADQVSEALRAGERPVSIAGDCCTAIGVMAGLQHSEFHPFLVWFDAHGDFNTWDTTPSGFLGGMPLAMIVGRGEQTFVDAVDLKPQDEDQVILTDGRDLDPGERESVEESAIHHTPYVLDLLDLPLPEAPLYVHFDVDVLNPEVAPAMSYPAEGGPSQEELQEVFWLLSETGRVVAVSMSSWNPDFDADGQTQTVCMDLLRVLLGE
ncbi:MAG: hypothetical protein GTO18_13040 [Anaerolineales bacterium]|nr:hypothetical protein [Anaerolineales bacterium]